MSTIIRKLHVVFIIAALIVISFGVLSPAPARALSCAADSYEVDSSIEGADAIFAGKVTSLNPKTISGGYAGAMIAGIDTWSNATFDVSKYWKGNVTKTMNVKVALYGWYSETPSFEEGKEYLIYADEHPEISGLVVYVDCHRQPLLSEASEDLAALGTGTIPATTSGGTGTGTGTTSGGTGTGTGTTSGGTGTGTGTGSAPVATVNYGDPVPTNPTNQPTTQPTTSSTFTRNLSIGARGQDVAQLQTILEQKGFLVMPLGVAKGYFGPLTRAALAQYQASVGISPAVGFFGPITRNYIQ